ncbi:hypothetical protein [Kocuria sp. APC 4018]|uniref:hypothetical protein n=1 Tax=Kocuria sp. APC 4018 TaxID=3035196 RepID=UPI0025B3BA5B|nr:hypothetical protein [Kocuria sp. APC 4018]MDN3463227.1 hypothetical protein [Kocuria sp. APC 4018]
MNKDEKAIIGYVTNLEKLADKIGVKNFLADGLEGHLDLQESLFDLQIELQGAIRKAKQRNTKGTVNLDHLNQLRWLRWQSRRLGDAIAWSGLLFNRQVIYALAKNEPVPIPLSWSDGHRGTFQFARGMTSSEWGIPVVHDVTNVLRVGDITFVRPTGQDAEADYRTVKIKATRVDESINEDGDNIVTLNVTAIGNEPFPVLGAEARASEAGRDQQPARRFRADRRVERQLARMDIATASKNAPLNKSTKIADRHVFSLSLPDEEQPHWQALRHAIRNARREGYAYFELGGFVGYSVIYDSTGVSKESIQSAPLIERVQGLIHEEIGDRNSISLTSLPDDKADVYSSKTLPFYLWEVPRRAIRDILRQRLVIVATYNSGWMEKLLSEAGLTVIPDKTGRDHRSFEVVASFEWEGEARVEYHSHVWEEMVIAVHEFRGPKAVVQRALAPLAAPSLARLNDFVPTEALQNDQGHPPEQNG